MTTPTGPHETPHDPAAPANTPNTPYDPAHYGPYGQMLPTHPQYGQQPIHPAPAPEVAAAPPGPPANLRKDAGPAAPPYQYPPQPYPHGSPFPGGPSPAEPVAVPQTVTSAVLVFAAVLVANMINVFMLLGSRGFDEAMRANLVDQGMNASDIVSAMNLFEVLKYVTLAATAGLSVLFILKMRAGRNWARVVLTVVAAFGSLSLLSGGSTSSRMIVNGQSFDLDISPVLTLAAGALSVAGLVLLWLKPTSAYMNAKKIEKARKQLGY